MSGFLGVVTATPGGAWSPRVEPGVPVAGLDLWEPQSRERAAHSGSGEVVGPVRVVMDGALTNADELRAALATRGAGLLGDDPAIVLALYEAYGEAFVHLLRGSFAVAVWDGPRARLWLARDHLGTRTLYHSRSGARLAFSTDLALLLGMPEVSREPDPRGILDYLTLGGTMAPRTMFRDVRKLAAGHRLRWQDGRESVEQYWAPVLSEVERSLSASVVIGEWERLAEATWRDRSEGWVVCLDDGPGSRILAAQRAGGVSDARMNHIAVDDPDGRAASKSARRLAEHLGCQHVGWFLAADEVAGGLADMVRQSGMAPGDEAMALEHWRFQRAASAHDRALRGDGATALLGARDGLGHLLPGVDVGHRGREPDWLDRTFSREEIAGLWGGALRTSAWAEELQPALQRMAEGGGENPVNRAIAVELGCMIPETRLAPLQALAGPARVDCRYPFLDQHLVATVNALGPRLKIDGWWDRSLWSRLAGRLPAWARRASRAGSPVLGPGGPSAFARLLLEPDRIRGAGYFEPSMVARLVEDHRRGRAGAAERLWRVFGVQLWHEVLIAGRAPAESSGALR